MTPHNRAAAAVFAALAIAFALPAAADDLDPLKGVAQREAARGNAGARAMVALLDGQRDRDTVVKAMDWLQDAAERGVHEAQFQLGFQYETAPAPDLRRAAEWYIKAAQQGNVLAQSNLASMFLFGKGVPRNTQAALELSLKAAEKGNAVSQARLGAMYAAGDGAPQDALKAEYWLEKAAEQGYLDAQSHLGIMLVQGDYGAERNLEKGLPWLKTAAARGQPHARAALAKAIKDGVPGASDPLPSPPKK